MILHTCYQWNLFTWGMFPTGVFGAFHTFPVFCCLLSPDFETRCLHQIQNKHVFTELSDVAGVKHQTYCPCTVFNCECVRKDPHIFCFIVSQLPSLSSSKAAILWSRTVTKLLLWGTYILTGETMTDFFFSFLPLFYFTTLAICPQRHQGYINGSPSCRTLSIEAQPTEDSQDGKWWDKASFIWFFFILLTGKYLCSLSCYPLCFIYRCFVHWVFGQSFSF